MRARLTCLGDWLIFGLLFASAGCSAHGPGSEAEPPKVTAMVSLLHSLHDARAVAGEQGRYEVTIAPALSQGSRTNASEAGYGHRLLWCEDTIGKADVATVVEKVTKGNESPPSKSKFISGTVSGGSPVWNWHGSAVLTSRLSWTSCTMQS